MSMAASIESRVPFLDHQLVEFVATLPDEMKLSGWTTKRILREAMKGVLPESILNRPKMGFPVPFGAWTRGALERRRARRAPRSPDAASAASSTRRRSTGCCAITRPAGPTAGTASGACSTSNSGIAPSSIRTAFRRCPAPYRPPPALTPMRILWLKSDLLLPLDKGGKLRTWHLMRHLARRHEITYLSFADPDQPRADIEGMREVAVRVETIPRSDPPKAFPARSTPTRRCHLADPLPYAVGKYRSRAYRRRFRELLRKRAFDLIVCDFLPPAVNLPARLPCPASSSRTTSRPKSGGATRKRRRRRPAGCSTGRSTAGCSRSKDACCARFDGVLAVSEADRDTFARLYPGAARRPMQVVATGVDTRFFAPAAERRPRSRLVFTGSMDWLPNEDAMLYFCRDILPLIRAREPEVTLSIVGRAPTPAVQKLAAEHGIVVTGRVDDVRPFMRDAAVYIVPLRIGGGTRLKIFEAMAMGKAVVSTTVGAEGLPVTDGEHVRLADDPATFADAVVRLLRDVDARRSLEAAARTLVVARYDWSAVAGELEEAHVSPGDVAFVPGHVEHLGNHAMHIDDGFSSQIADAGLDIEAAIRLDYEQTVEAHGAGGVGANRHAHAAHLRAAAFRLRFPLVPAEQLCAAVERLFDELADMVALAFHGSANGSLPSRCIDVPHGYLIHTQLACGFSEHRFHDDHALHPARLAPRAARRG